MKKINADISLGATKKEREDTVKRFKKMQRLLLNFNLSTVAFDPGVRCLRLYDNLSSGEERVKYIDFDDDTWEWIEPLLRELLKYRRKYEVASKKSR